MEFKVFAELKNKQNPRLSDFWSPEGYGSILKNRYGFETFHYVVIGRECEIDGWKGDSRAIANPNTQGIPYRFASWSELSKRVEASSPLVDDLFYSLANLGINEVNGFMTRAKTIRSGIEETVVALGILKSVLEEHQVDVEAGDLAHSTPGDAEWSFGYDVSDDALGDDETLSSIAKLKPSVLKGHFLWLGYGGFESAKVAPQIHCYWDSKVEDIAQRFQPDHSVVTLRRDGKTLNIVLTPATNSSMSDQEWFKRSLKFLATEANKAEGRRS